MTGPTERLPTSDDTTVELPRPDTRQDGHPSPAGPRPGGPWRELTGALAIGLCGLALVVLALQIYAWAQPDVPGPGLVVLLGHVAAAVAAWVAQRQADRARGPQAVLAMLLVAIAVGVVLWFFWWA